MIPRQPGPFYPGMATDYCADIADMLPDVALKRSFRIEFASFS
jgi:hypothetical protein